VLAGDVYRQTTGTSCTISIGCRTGLCHYIATKRVQSKARRVKTRQDSISIVYRDRLTRLEGFVWAASAQGYGIMRHNKATEDYENRVEVFTFSVSVSLRAVRSADKAIS
jgi:hypothetical protein